MPTRLPADPVLRAVDALCAQRSASLRQVLDPTTLRAYSRAKRTGSLTLGAVDRFCDGPLRCNPRDLYGAQYDQVVLGDLGADAEVHWLEDFRLRAAGQGVGPPIERGVEAVAEVVPAEELSGRRAAQLGDLIVDNLAVFLDGTGHGAQLRALLGSAADELLARDDHQGPALEIG